MLDILSPTEMESLLLKIDEQDVDPETEIKRAVIAKAEQLRDLLDVDDDPTSEILDIMENGELSHAVRMNSVREAQPTGGGQ
jgi:hypothetical protein